MEDPSNLMEILQLNTIQQLEWLCEVDGEQAVCLEGSFSAQQLDFTPPRCP